MSRPESPEPGSAAAVSASEGEEGDAEEGGGPGAARRRPRDDAASQQAARLLLSMQRESEVLRSFLRFDIGADSEADAEALAAGRGSPGPAGRVFRRAAAAAVAVSPTGSAPTPAGDSKRAGSSAPASRRRPRSQPQPVAMEGGKKLSPFQQIMREIKMKRSAANARASRSRRSRRVVQEEEYTDKDRAAAANMGSRDIKQSLKLKRKQERSRALQIPEEARPGALLALGRREMRRGNLRTAIGFVHKALELNPRDVNALVCRSRCHLLMGEPQMALQDAEAALRIDNNFVKAIFQKAEALYNTGDFEHSLMFYHRGQRLRPELDAFRLGVQKTQQAIQNTIGQALTGPEARRALRCQSARRPSDGEASCAAGGSCTTSASTSSSGSSRSSVSTRPASSGGCAASAGRSRERARSPSGRRLLGELCVDKEYLERLLQNPDINSLQPNGASIIATEAEEAVSFLKTRQEVWRQQYPISINASKLKIHRN